MQVQSSLSQTHGNIYTYLNRRVSPCQTVKPVWHAFRASLFLRLEPDVVSGNSLLGTFAKSKRWELACSFFCFFFKQRQPNAISRPLSQASKTYESHESHEKQKNMNIK